MLTPDHLTNTLRDAAHWLESLGQIDLLAVLPWALGYAALAALAGWHALSFGAAKPQRADQENGDD
ncbi:hypothetical protein [Paenarthrobacter sp. NPDC090522]|uniref:hypothetical protein n=1 Tax=Paenarthrobacter sp. NPDC090522 TaxID=3364383 RepID=UPI00381A9783